MKIIAIGKTVGQREHRIEITLPNNEYDLMVAEKALNDIKRHYSLGVGWEIFDDAGNKLNVGIKVGWHKEAAR